MAREPVPIDPKQPVREPIPIEEVAAIVAVETGRKIAPLDDEGTRQCAREGCPNRFKPEPEKVQTQAYCSDECMLIVFYKKNHGKTLSVEEARRKARARESGDRVIIDEEGKTRTRKQRGASADPAVEEAKEKKYGPLRTCGETIGSPTKGARRVRFTECGHEGSVARLAKRGRCRICRDAASGEPPKKRGRKPKSESTRETTSATKTKREPIPIDDASAERPAARADSGRPTREPVPLEPEGQSASGGDGGETDADSDGRRKSSGRRANSPRKASRQRNGDRPARRTPARATASRKSSSKSRTQTERKRQVKKKKR